MKVYAIHTGHGKIYVPTVEIAEQWVDYYNQVNPIRVNPATIEPITLIEVGPPGKGVMDSAESS